MAISNTFILGAGITGLAAGWRSGLPVFEASDIPGGISRSYYVLPGNKKGLRDATRKREAYRFEIGGGHWIFGADEVVLRFINQFVELGNYKRNSSVYLSKKDLYIPYPLQNNLRFLGEQTAKKALEEILRNPKQPTTTMEEWLTGNFGSILCELFFYPFHDLYTAGLYKSVASQDNYKSPVNIALATQGACQKVPPVGYNVNFTYPAHGLGALTHRIAASCNIRYRKHISKIDIKNKNIRFTDGNVMPYDTLISTLPLNRAVELTGLKVDREPDPYTSALVLNIGALRGKSCPGEHWLYIPDSDSGFYRVGFYSNVDASFLPAFSQKDDHKVSIYVERAYPNYKKPSQEEIKTYVNSTLKELEGLGFIKDVEALDTTWTEVAYTWSWPGSSWKEKAIKLLEKDNIYQIGRYGRWKFKGIADSIKDGLSVERFLHKEKPDFIKPVEV